MKKVVSLNQRLVQMAQNGMINHNKPFLPAIPCSKCFIYARFLENVGDLIYAQGISLKQVYYRIVTPVWQFS